MNACQVGWNLLSKLPYRTCGISFQVLKGTSKIQFYPRRLLHGFYNQKTSYKTNAGNKAMVLIYRLTKNESFEKIIVPVHYWILGLSIPTIVYLAYPDLNEKFDGDWFDIKKYIATFMESKNRKVDESQNLFNYAHSVDLFMIVLPLVIVLFGVCRFILSHLVLRMHVNKNVTNFEVVTYGWSMLPKRVQFKLSEIEETGSLFGDSSACTLKVKNKKYVLFHDSFLDKRVRNTILYGDYKDETSDPSGSSVKRKTFLRK